MNRTIVIVTLAAALLVLPLFTNPYWTDVCVSIGLYALLALSLNVILGQAGIFHMGHAAFFAVGAYSTAILNTMHHWPIFLTMPVAGCAAALFALVVARPIIHLRGDYLLIVTIGIVEIVRIALINDVGGLTGGSNGIFGISRPVFFGFRIFKPLHFYYLVWGMVGISLLLFYGLWRSRIGRALNCIKEDDVAAEGCGINVTHYKLMAFVLGAFWAGMAGPLYAAKMTTIAPESFNFMESVIIFAVVILSGGSQLGVLVSAFLFIGLPELLRELCKMDFTWIRLHYLYPDQITDELIDVIAEEPKIVKYLDIPLQHVSKRILRAMHRPGDGAEFTKLIEDMRRRIPGLVLRTSLIVGLPGETDDEFAELCEFLQNAAIERVGVFEYSPEEGTEAAEMPDQIDAETKQNRRLIVEELQSGVLDDYNTSRHGEVMQVLVEGFDDEQQLWYGRTYADSVEVDGHVYFDAMDTEPGEGEFVSVLITESLGPDLLGVRQKEA